LIASSLERRVRGVGVKMDWGARDVRGALRAEQRGYQREKQSWRVGAVQRIPVHARRG
jgi:hypothetical protein